jgi:voltage-gated potassium channel
VGLGAVGADRSTAGCERVSVEAYQTLPVAERRRLIVLGLSRALVVSAVLIALYFTIPLDRIANAPLGVSLVAGLIVLGAVAIYQIRAIIRSAHPGVRAIEALATITPLFLLLFGAIYYLAGHSSPDGFSVHALTRTDALYFTVTVFSTVGFGDITATSQATRLLVTAQMILDLLILGLGIRVFFGAVQMARHQPSPPDQESAVTTRQP